jgi:hypothetical protein
VSWAGGAAKAVLATSAAMIRQKPIMNFFMKHLFRELDCGTNLRDYGRPLNKVKPSGAAKPLF